MNFNIYIQSHQMGELSTLQYQLVSLATIQNDLFILIVLKLYMESKTFS
jgi:hypothetical protein